MTTVVIYDGQDSARLAEIQQRYEIAQRPSGPLRVGDVEDPVEVQAELEAFAAEVIDRAEVWHLEHIGHLEYMNLMEKHPPRRTDEGEVDERDWRGYNSATFPLDLLSYVDPEDDEIRTVVKVTKGDEKILRDSRDLKRRIKRLSLGEFTKLWIAAAQLNEAMPADPKDVMPSTGRRGSSETSSSPDRLG